MGLLIEIFVRILMDSRVCFAEGRVEKGNEKIGCFLFS
jgi:hypothetical protein